MKNQFYILLCSIIVSRIRCVPTVKNDISSEPRLGVIQELFRPFNINQIGSTVDVMPPSSTVNKQSISKAITSTFSTGITATPSTATPDIATTTLTSSSTASVAPTPQGGATNSSNNSTSVSITAKIKKDFSQCGLPRKSVFRKTEKLTKTNPTIRRNFWQKIFGGTATLDAEYPWVAYLYLKHNGKKDGFFCSGAIINQFWVVTAAHCITQPFSPEVYGITFGKHNSLIESPFEVDRNVSKIILHPDYSPITLKNDIVLLKIHHRIRYRRRQQPICIPPQDFPTDATFGKTFAAKKCTTLGWGTTETAPRSDILLRLNLLILPHILCETFTKFPTSLPYQGNSVEPKDPMFCAGGKEGEDTCRGDSGGPLICLHDEDGRFYLHGITSYGANPCGQKNLPGVYTTVSRFTNWIIENTNSTK